MEISWFTEKSTGWILAPPFTNESLSSKSVLPLCHAFYMRLKMMLLNCGGGEDSWESLGLQGDLKGNQSWIFIGRTDAKAETPIIWPPRVKNWLIVKDSDAGRDWGQEEKGTTEDEMAGWHHQLDGHESEWTPGVGDGQGGLACCDSWGRKESDTTEWLNWIELKDVLWVLHEIITCEVADT